MSQKVDRSADAAHTVRRILILFSDTGGGHRSSARAVAQALEDAYDQRVHVTLVDLLADYAPWPLNRLAKVYPYMVCLKGAGWAAGYHLSNGALRVRIFLALFWPWVRPALRRLFDEHPADVVLSCHPLFNHLPRRILMNIGIPLITLVTDLASAHAFWCDPDVDRCLVPTEAGRRQALANGTPAERILLTGLPVERRFVSIADESPQDVRRRLGVDPHRPLVLLVGGSEGMGPVYRLSRKLARRQTPVQMVIVTGRNRKLCERLSAERWPLPVSVQGFVDNMHEWMRAANLLVTKAGPSTICEALVLGLPMVICGALPGQERPNVDYVVAAGAGVWAPTPEQVVAEVSNLLTSEHARLRVMAERAQALGRPDAARWVAQVVWDAAGSSRV